MIYTVRFSHEAEKDFGRLDQTTRRRVLSRAEHLSENPYNPRVGKPLKGVAGIRSSRIGSWRMLYQVHQQGNTGEVEIIAIRPRGSVYRNL